MIGQYLENHLKNDKLYNSYLINTDSLDGALQEIEKFLGMNVLSTEDLENSPDYMMVKREDSKTRNVSVSQVRQMQDFLYKTSVISGKKVAVIYEADLMNLNAANCCLKILEDTPANTHLFLLTNNGASIMPTIRSRCAKINHDFNVAAASSDNSEYILPLLKSTKLEDKLTFIARFSSRDRDLWNDFAASIQELLVKLCKISIGLNVKTTAAEKEFYESLKQNNSGYLQEKYDAIKEIIDDTNEFDLEIKNSVTLIVEKMRAL